MRQAVSVTFPNITFVLLMILTVNGAAFAQVERIWLTHKSGDPGRLVVNWETAQPGDSVVRFGLSTNREQIVSQQENVTLHHVEIPTPARDTNQTCHDFHRGSPQFEWYRGLMEPARPGLVVTLQNERNAAMRAQENGAWHEMFRRGTLVVSGYGYYAERAVVDGFSYYNVCIAAPGAPYRDPKAVSFESASSYLLLTLRQGTGEMTAELKRLDGTVIDKQNLQKRR